ncbi:MAG: hypothetical protein AAF741_03085 [Bacteroidota bacterium]
MRPHILITSLIIVLASFGCKEDTGLTEGKVDRSARLTEDINGPNHPGANAPSVTLRVGQGEVAKGEMICLPFEVTDFKNMLGFQYTIRFDSTKFKYEKVENFGLPGYGPPDFGTRFESRGVLSSLWSDPNLKPRTLPDGSKLFDLCLTAIGKAGDKSVVMLSNGPTPFEFIDDKMTRYRLRYANGEVTIK